MTASNESKVWPIVAFACSVGLAALVLASTSIGKDGIREALAATARFSFLLFWPAYAGSALVSLFGTSLQWLKSHAPHFGLAFASALSVHLGLVLWLCLIGATPGASVFAIFGVAAFFALLMSVCTIGAVRKRISANFWWYLSKIGMNYVIFAFAYDFVFHPIEINRDYVIGYLPFVFLVILGPLLRIAAAAKSVVSKFTPLSVPADRLPRAAQSPPRG